MKEVPKLQAKNRTNRDCDSTNSYTSGS